MTNLLERLRRYSCESDDPTEPLAELVKDLHEAADRIAELEAANERLLEVYEAVLPLTHARGFRPLVNSSEEVQRCMKALAAVQEKDDE